MFTNPILASREFFGSLFVEISDARGSIARGTDDHNLRNEKRRLFLDSAALDYVVSRVRTGIAIGSVLSVSNDFVGIFDEHFIVFRHRLQYFAALALVFAGDYLDGIALFHL